MLKKANSGFTLIETLIYLSVLITMVTLLIGFAIGQHAQLQKSSRQMNATLALHSLIDHIGQDIRFMQPGGFKRAVDNEYIFSCGNYDIGWAIKKNKLRRFIGHYDAQRQYWHNKKSVIVSQSCDAVMMERRGRLVRLEVACRTNKGRHQVVCFISPLKDTL